MMTIPEWKWDVSMSIVTDSLSPMRRRHKSVLPRNFQCRQVFQQLRIGSSMTGCMLISTPFPEIIRMTVSILTGFLAIIFWVRPSLGARIGNVPVHLVSRVALTGICGRSLLMCSFVGIISWIPRIWRGARTARHMTWLLSVATGASEGCSPSEYV